MDCKYEVQFFLMDDEAVIPLITTVYTSIPYWNDITEQQKQEELISFAIDQLEEVEIYINKRRIKSVVIKEVL